MFIKDLIEIFAEKYGKKIRKVPIRPGEKIHEALINTTQSMRCTYTGGFYMVDSHLVDNSSVNSQSQFDYDSSMDTIKKQELYEYLTSLSLC
jgi:FlaA1/EpsC-like NDP-sugar epimerase